MARHRHNAIVARRIRPGRKRPSMSGWYVYMVRCADDTLYTGISKNVGKRIKGHNYDYALGSRYTRPRRPVTLAYQEAARSRSEATQRERIIRRLTRKQKEALIKGANRN